MRCIALWKPRKAPRRAMVKKGRDCVADLKVQAYCRHDLDKNYKVFAIVI